MEASQTIDRMVYLFININVCMYLMYLNLLLYIDILYKKF